MTTKVRFESDLNVGLVDPDAIRQDLFDMTSQVKGIGRHRRERLLEVCMNGGAVLTYKSISPAGTDYILFVVPSPIKRYEFLLCELWDIGGQGYLFVVESDCEDLWAAVAEIERRVKLDYPE